MANQTHIPSYTSPKYHSWFSNEKYLKFIEYQISNAWNRHYLSFALSTKSIASFDIFATRESHFQTRASSFTNEVVNKLRKQKSTVIARFSSINALTISLPFTTWSETAENNYIFRVDRQQLRIIISRCRPSTERMFFNTIHLYGNLKAGNYQAV